MAKKYKDNVKGGFYRPRFSTNYYRDAELERGYEFAKDVAFNVATHKITPKITDKLINTKVGSLLTDTKVGKALIGASDKILDDGIIAQMTPEDKKKLAENFISDSIHTTFNNMRGIKDLTTNHNPLNGGNVSLNELDSYLFNKLVPTDSEVNRLRQQQQQQQPNHYTILNINMNMANNDFMNQYMNDLNNFNSGRSRSRRRSLWDDYNDRNN